MRKLKRNRTNHKSWTRNVNRNVDSNRYGMLSSIGSIDARALSDITNYSTNRKRLVAPSLGKAAKLESRPENANRANPELRALGHQTPGRAEWGKKTRTRQNGSSREQQSRSSPERGMGKSAHVPRMARQRAQERTDSSMVNPERFPDRAETVRVSNSSDTRPKKNVHKPRHI